MASTSTTQSPLLVPRGVLEGRPAIPINRPVWIIGSRKGCHLHLDSKHVSQAHAVIINTGRGLFIKDLASREHTYVNRLPIKEVLLKDGDKVQIGAFKFYFKDPTANPGDKPPVAPLSLLKVSGERIPLPLESRVTFIGRRSSADINLTEESVSNTHALLIDLDGEHYIRDLGSRTGTFLNGQKIDRQAPLSPGDVIRIGETEMAYDQVVGSAVAEEEPAESSGESAIALQLDDPEPAAVEEEHEPMPAADLDDALGLTPADADAPAEAEPLPMELDLVEPAAVEEAEAPAELEVSATATPVVEPEAPAIEPEPEVEAEAEPEPVAELPAAEPTPKGGRRGWKLWGTRQPGPTVPTPPVVVPPIPKVEVPKAASVESPAPAPMALSEPLELSEPLAASEPSEVVDLSSADESHSHPVVDLAADEPAALEEAAAEPEALAAADLDDALGLTASADEPLSLEPLESTAQPAADEPSLEEHELPLEPIEDDATDTAYAVELSPSAAKDAPDEVTAGDLELSAVEEPHTLDLEASTESEPAAVATADEGKAEDVFEGVDLDALALDALNEPETRAEEVSATLDLAAAAEPESVESEVVPPPALDLGEPEPLPAVEETVAELELAEPEAPAPLEESPATLDLPTPEDEKPDRDEPPTAPVPIAPTAPRGGGGESDLPPALETPVRIKPSTRRRKRGDDNEPPRRRGPVRGRGGKFISAAEAAAMAAAEESAGQSDIDAPDQFAVSATSGAGEVLESTEPTPESALNLDADTPSAPDEIALPADEAVPSDSVFGKAVEEMAGGASTGDLVDEGAPKQLSPLEQIAADATHFVDTDAPVHEGVELEPSAELDDEIFEHEDVLDEVSATGDVTIAEEHTLDLSGAAEPIEAMADEAPESRLDLSGEPEPLEPIAESLELPAVSEEPAEAEPIAEAAPLELPAIDEEPAVAQSEEHAELELPESEAALELPTELSFDETFEPTEATSLAGDAAPAEPSHTVSEAVEPPTIEPEAPVAEIEQPRPIVPGNFGFFGISRDADTFLGGMPLSLPPLAPPPPTFGKVGVSFDQSQARNSHVAPLPPPLMIGEDDDTVTAEDLETSQAAAEIAPPAEPPLVEPPADYTATGAPVMDADSNDSTVAIPALPVDEVSATTDAPASPKLPVPPRPRRNRLADYEKRFAKVDEDKALEAMLREQQQSTTSRNQQPGQPSGFDGLTMGPSVRQTDVFSDSPSAVIPVAETGRPDPFVADKQASIDLAARNIDTGRIPPVAAAPTSLTAPGIDTPANGTDPFGLQVPAVSERGKPPRQTARYSTSAPDFNYTGPQRGSRKISIRVLVMAMVVFMIGAGAAGFLLTPVYTNLQAKVLFSNLKDRSVFDQHKFRTEQQAVLTSESVRSAARSALLDQYPKLDPGLLADPLAFDTLSRDLDWPAGTNEMRLKLKSIDAEGDQKRLDVLLKALFTENKHLIDVGAQKKLEFDKAQAEVDQLNVQLKELLAKIREAQNSLSDAPSASLITQVEQDAAQLRSQWGETVSKVEKLKYDLERLAPNGGAEAPAPQPGDAPVVDVAGGDPEKDPVVIQAREELKALQAEITRLKAAGSEDATEKARQALDAAVKTYGEALATLRTGKGADWQDFLAKASKLQGMTMQMTGDIIARQREEQAKLAELKRTLEKELDDRREKLFASDPELKKQTDNLRLATRMANVAAAEGMAAEEGRWRTEAAKAEASIAIQKAKLAEDPEFTKRVAEVQKLIDDGKAAIASDRNTLDKQMAEALKDFLGSGRELYKKLGDDDKKAAESLASRAGQMVEAHNLYGNQLNSVKAGDSDVLVKKEADARQVAANIDRRIAEIKDADRKNKSALEKQAQAKQIEDTRAALAAAEKSQSDARDKWLAKQQELADLRSKAALAKTADDKLQENQRLREQAQATIAGKVRELDDRRKKDLSFVVPEPIAPDAISVTGVDDARWKYALISSMGVCGLFLILIWLGGYHHSPVGGPHRPAIESVAPSKEGVAGDEETIAV